MCGHYWFFCNFGVEKYSCITEEKVSSYRDDGICVFLLLGIPLSMEGRQKSKQGKQRDSGSPPGQFQQGTRGQETYAQELSAGVKVFM